MPYASRVAAMFRSMNGGDSLSAAFGRTENCSTTRGYTAPTRIDESTSSAVASAGGMRRSRNTIAAKKAIAQMIAMDIRMSFAGRTAWMSV